MTLFKHPHTVQWTSFVTENSSWPILELKEILDKWADYVLHMMYFFAG